MRPISPDESDAIAIAIAMECHCHNPYRYSALSASAKANPDPMKTLDFYNLNHMFRIMYIQITITYFP